MLNFLSENMVVLTLACLALVIFLVIVFFIWRLSGGDHHQIKKNLFNKFFSEFH